MFALNMPREIQKMAFAVLIFSEGFGVSYNMVFIELISLIVFFMKIVY